MNISIKNIDIKKTVVSNKVSFGKKGFKYWVILVQKAQARIWKTFLS